MVFPCTQNEMFFPRGSLILSVYDTSFMTYLLLESVKQIVTLEMQVNQISSLSFTGALESPELPELSAPGFQIKKAKCSRDPPAQINGTPDSATLHGEPATTPEIPALKTPYLKHLVSAKKVRGMSHCPIWNVLCITHGHIGLNMLPCTRILKAGAHQRTS